MKNILNYWYEMEYFNPCWPIENKSDINLNKVKLPWPKEEEKENIRTSFDIYIGQLSSEQLIKWMICKLKLSTEEKIESDNSLSCLCALKVDATGKYVIGSFAVSSFVWAICELVENGYNSDLLSKELGALQESANKKLVDDSGDPVYVNKTTLISISEFICKEINLDLNIIEQSLWAKEKKQKGVKATKESNEYTFPPLETTTELMSSYYLKDIKKIQETPTEKIAKYIGAMKPLQKDEKVQIDSNVQEMKKWTAAKRYPLGIWPSKYHPCLMQQISINLAISNEQPIFSVNGPPGTGKTTLLKEIIVSNIIERAKVMSEYSKPDDAFDCKEFSNPPDVYNKAFYVPNKDLTSFGIVVASNNNAAVENISVELPKQIEKDRTGRFSVNSLREDRDDYFSEIATDLLKEPTWGLISAKLGKKSNLKNFVQSLWWNDSIKNIKKYYDASSNKLDWNKAKQNFKDALNCVVNSRLEIELIQKRFSEYKKLQEDIEIANNEFCACEINLKNLLEEIENIKTEIANLKSLQLTKKNNIELLLKELSFAKKLLWWFFKSNPLIVEWKLVELEVQKLVIEITKKCDLLQNKDLMLIELKRDCENHKNKSEKLILLYDKFSDEINEYKNRFGKSITDDKFWECIENNENSQNISPWTDELYDSQREELFYQALMLNKAFVLNSNAVKQNLMRLITMWDDKFISKDKKLAYSSLINTLLILVPVISTTFASVESFFEEVGAEELGLLVIDESGQATPQSALGAIWRSRKVVIVGDPLQVEPIVTVPKELQIRLADKNNIPSAYRIPELSVQILGDSLNNYGGLRKANNQLLWVGCPLVLHRRCLDPMFSISNEVAYNNRMFKQTQDPNSKISLSISESFWMDVKGKMKEKGNQNVLEQNDAAVMLFEKALKSSADLPSIFIISPFKKVAQEIKIKISSTISKYKINIEDKNKKEWIDSHCGTIHSFQGKEANEVILVLGCDTVVGNGAANWVGAKPNIINVAVSRAKYRLCIIGDYEQWIKIPNINIACSKLKRVKTDVKC